MKKTMRVIADVAAIAFLSALSLCGVFLLGILVRLVVWVFSAGFSLPGGSL